MDQYIEYLENFDPEYLYSVYKTVHEMMSDRNYAPNATVYNKSEFVSFYKGMLAEQMDSELTPIELSDGLSLFFNKIDSEVPDTVMVYFFIFNVKIPQLFMEYILQKYRESDATHLIVIFNEKETQKIRNINMLEGSEIFYMHELTFNVTKHVLVPKHTKIEDDERYNVITQYATNSKGETDMSLIPGIGSSDPVVKYYNFKADDIIRIDRPRKDGYTDIYYRAVHDH